MGPEMQKCYREARTSCYQNRILSFFVGSCQTFATLRTLLSFES